MVLPDRSIKALFVLSFAWATVSCVQAQPGNLTLPECLSRAKENYPLIKAKRAQVMSEEERFRSSRTEHLPAFLAGGQLNYGTNNSLSGSYFPNEGLSISTSGGIRPDQINTAVFGSFGTLEVDWRVFNFGRITANIAAARSAVQAAQADYENELFQHLVRTTDAYLLTLIAEKITRLQQDNLERARQLYLITRAESMSGMKAGTDSLFASAEVSKARILFLESQRNEKTQRIRLAELIGEKESEIRIDTAKFLNSVPPDFPTRPGIENSPLLKLYQSQIDFRKSRSVAVRRSYAPSILLSGMGWARGSGVSRVDDSFRTDFSSGAGFQVANYMAVVSFRFNILNYSKVRHDYRSEVMEMDRVKYLYDEAELRANKQLEIADIQFSVATQQAKEAPVQLSAAKSSYLQSRARYSSGLSSLADLAQNFYILNRAEVDKSIAINNVWRALLLKSAATGDLSYLTDQIN